MSATNAGSQRIVRVGAPLRKQVTDLLREAIGRLEFEPGERLVERDLCERFDVSRTVVREALRHLEAEGLVESVAGRGPVVATVTAAEARDLYEAREALESCAAQYCARRATDEQKLKLAAAVANIGAAYRDGTLADAVGAKDGFYEALFEGAGNATIASLLRTLQTRAHMLRAYSLQAPGRMDDSLEELRGVLEAINRSDERTARELAAWHVRNAGAAALTRLEQYERETAQDAS